MKKLIFTFSILLSILHCANADEKYNHFPALNSADITAAFCNIQSYNKKLAAITSKSELTAEDMVKVHELTYTLENAVNLLKQSLEQVSVHLEDVHKASERLDANVIKSSGEKYLKPTTMMLSAKKC